MQRCIIKTVRCIWCYTVNTCLLVFLFCLLYLNNCILNNSLKLLSHVSMFLHLLLIVNMMPLLVNVIEWITVSDIHRMPVIRESRYSLVVCKKLPQEQDRHFLCYLQTGKSYFSFAEAENFIVTIIYFLAARRYATATCLSVTRRYCVKTKTRRKVSVMIYSPSGSPTILVFWCQISSQNSKGVTPSEGFKQGRGG